MTDTATDHPAGDTLLYVAPGTARAEAMTAAQRRTRGPVEIIGPVDSPQAVATAEALDALPRVEADDVHGRLDQEMVEILLDILAPRLARPAGGIFSFRSDTAFIHAVGKPAGEMLDDAVIVGDRIYTSVESAKQVALTLLEMLPNRVAVAVRYAEAGMIDIPAAVLERIGKAMRSACPRALQDITVTQVLASHAPPLMLRPAGHR